ncbi:S46 family peptidase [Flavobacterium sp. U410]
MKLLKLLILFITFPIFAQQGGMWIPSLLKGMNENEMHQLGMKINAQDIYDANQTSIKDAIVHFDGGCTAEIISPKGLLLTNHHCGYDAIQNHSSVEHDYLQDGFWAKSTNEELANPKMVATLIASIHDVTNTVLEGVAQLSSETEKQRRIEENINRIQKTFPKEAWQENRIKTFYEGNQYILFVTETFKDVRLVGAPPSSIGKFGSDTDNWVWPRHTGDFSIFRIYAGKDNKPAEYSKDNVPYTPKHFLPISLDGISEGDFTMVFGFPGRTQEYLPSFAVEQIVNTLNPAKIEIRDAALKVQDGFMRKDQAIKIQYASKYARIANYWKKWIGESQGLKKSNAVQLKKDFETEFQKRITQKGKQEEYGNLLADFEKNYKAIDDYALARDYFVEIALRNTELLSVGFKLYQLEQVYKTKGEQAFNDRKENTLKSLEGFYKDFNVNVDEKVFEKLFALYGQKSPLVPAEFKTMNYTKTTTEVYSKSKLTSYSGLQSLLSGDANKVFKSLNKDKGYVLVKKMADNYFNTIAPKYDMLNLELSALQREYMKAQLELFPDGRFFPDANSTLRITYGQVKGYNPSDAVYYEPVTHLEGVMEKYIPGDYEFDVPSKLIELYKTKNYGSYADNGKMPVCFIATNHTTGGNSGSPALDAQGNLIGLNFDRVWEGTMSDIHYDPAICRNIMVDIRYVLFIIDKYADARNLIDEMHMVHPKNSKK